MLSRLLIGFALLGMATPAMAAEAGGGSDFYWQIANFVLLIAVLTLVLRVPVREFFAARRSGVKSDLDAAAELLDQAMQRHTEWQRKMIDLDADLETIRRESRERAEHERDQILKDATVSAERIKRDATAAVDQELRRARADLQREASDLAVELVEKILREQVVDSDRDRLADEFISQLERPAQEAR